MPAGVSSKEWTLPRLLHILCGDALGASNNPKAPMQPKGFSKPLTIYGALGMDWIAAARDLAERAHAGQVDKSGEPYILHCERVAVAVKYDRLCKNDDCRDGTIEDWDGCCGDPECCSPSTRPCPDCEIAVCVAWLHDVIEDAPEFAGCVHDFPAPIWHTVVDLTRDGKPSEYYYQRIRRNPVALRVKMADIRDNSDSCRLAKLDPATADRLRKKYARAIHYLTAKDGQ